MKNKRTGVDTHLVPVKTRDIVNLDTGEVSQMAMPVREYQADFGYLFLKGFHRVLTDRRLTGNALKVLSILFLHLPFDSNMAEGTTTYFQQELHISRQEWHKAVLVLRLIGAVLPSTIYGKYHLNMEVVYRGHLAVRKRLLRTRERTHL